jgi:hypothetical protein
MIKRRVLSVLLSAALVVFGSNVEAKGRRNGAGSHARSPAAASSDAAKAPARRPTHVRTYQKKDGTYVPAHDRRTSGRPHARAAARGSAVARATPRSSAVGAPRSRPGAVDPRSASSPSRPTRPVSPRARRGCTTCPRDAHGRISRSEQAKAQFMRQSGFPRGRPGFVVDHIKPLECGGSDAPSNMQWQTTAAARAKDKTEARCR